eukprot:TRINITY_DN1229_c0_g2_i1.p1 TRINITY_DN1229_c0_g2~~TRINITY_DN1229_c0_g2_i1.p1  ORF type:complete len:435 (+),score=55.11 TRINITY_DN1229_c0_g2_i1:57-1361(+)
MQVFVKRHTKECDYEINIDWTLKRLMEELKQDFRIDTEKYELTYEGDPMRATNLLISYGLVGGSQLLLDLKPSERMKRTLKHECRCFNRAAMLTTCSKGDMKAFEEIICTGYDLEPEKDPSNQIAHFLTVAAKCRQHKMVEHLLDLGFNPYHCKKPVLRVSKPRLHRPKFRLHHEYPLKWAIINNDIRLLELLHSRGYDLDSPKTSWGSSPLFFAFSKPKYLEVAKRMITLGADPALRNNRGHTTLSTAICTGNLEGVKFLMEHVAISEREMSELHSVATYMLMGQQEGISINSLLSKASNPTSPRTTRMQIFDCFKDTKIVRSKTIPWEVVPTIHDKHEYSAKGRTFTFVKIDNRRWAPWERVRIFEDKMYKWIKSVQHAHWMFLRRPKSEKKDTVQQPCESEPNAFWYSRGDTRGSRKNRNRGKISSRKKLH